MPAITVKAIVKALKTAPEKKFRISELAPQLLGENGKVDIVKAMDRQGELNIAIVEVETYIKTSRGLRKEIEGISEMREINRNEFDNDDDDLNLNIDDGDDE